MPAPVETFRQIAFKEYLRALKRGDVSPAEAQLPPRTEPEVQTGFRWPNHPGVVGDVEGDRTRDAQERALSPKAFVEQRKQAAMKRRLTMRLTFDLAEVLAALKSQHTEIPDHAAIKVTWAPGGSPNQKKAEVVVSFDVPEPTSTEQAR